MNIEDRVVGGEEGERKRRRDTGLYSLVKKGAREEQNSGPLCPIAQACTCTIPFRQWRQGGGGGRVRLCSDACI